ncbi:hypothetical protein ACOACO_07655 [Nocardioides sp. CPCC 205120]|uniref:hypothetical protein n=1 Tax=Nocardioides sp. CPCC 205120 TaxID=3406462 RepID=UPI003B5091DB
MSISGFIGLLARVRAAVLLLTGGAARRTQRGDVPGWVMVTVMTAGLVYAIWTFAGPELNAMLSRALGSVSGLG